MSVGPSITQCCLYVGFLQFPLLQGFSHAATSFRSLRKERKHLEQRQRVKRLTTDGKYRTYLQFSSHKDSFNSAFLFTEKLTHMFTKLSAFGVRNARPPFLSCSNLDVKGILGFGLVLFILFCFGFWRFFVLFCFFLASSRLRGYKDDPLHTE